MINIETNTLEVMSDLRADNQAFIDDITKGFSGASADMVEMFQREQLSGRKGDDTGLNIRSGTLYRSLSSGANVFGDTITAEVTNLGATYWEYHQEGTERLPKRLFFEESFEADGVPKFEDAIESAFARLTA
jgi:hypothetical protein